MCDQSAEEIELGSILEFIARLPSFGLTYSDETEAWLPGVVGRLGVTLDDIPAFNLHMIELFGAGRSNRGGARHDEAPADASGSGPLRRACRVEPPRRSVAS